MSDNPREILFVAQDGFAVPTARVRCYNFASALAQKGFRVDVLSYRDHLGASRHGADLPGMSWAEKLRLNWKALPRLLKTGPGSILYLQKVNYHALAPYVVSRFLRRRLVVDFDDYEYQDKRPDCWQNRVIRHVLRRAAACVTGSRFLEGWLRRFNSAVHLIPTGVDTSLFSPGVVDDRRFTLSDKPTLIWTGWVYDDTTLQVIDFLIDVWNNLRFHLPHLRLVLLLTGSKVGDVEKRVYAHPDRGGIVLQKDVPPEDVSAWLLKAHAGLLHYPVKSDWVRAKSPTKLFEYMACGVVPVCGRGTEADHVVTDGVDGILFDSVEESIEPLRQLLTDVGEWSRLSAAAIQKVRRDFSLTVLGDRLAEVLSRLRIQ